MLVDPASETRGYVLAGGLSARMGSDKSSLRLQGSTLLERAVTTMRHVCPDVAVVSRERSLPEDVRLVTDRLPGNGPIGGMEAALSDLREAGGRWAVFLPVDMPLVPAGLLRALVKLWQAEEQRRVGFVRMEGVDQPLVSAVAVEVLPELTKALEAGNCKLRPVLERAAQISQKISDHNASRGRCQSELTFEDRRRVLVDGEVLDWQPSEVEWAQRQEWFLNANTPDDLGRIREAMGRAGGS